MVELAEGVIANGVEFIIVDPAYLCVLRGMDPNDAKSMFAMGPHLARFAEAVTKAGATPCILHHANRGLAPGRTMELTDLAYAGFAEHTAQWLLLSRNEAYTGDGHHGLKLNAGGRQGQGGQWIIHADEGIVNEDFSGRTWEVNVTPADEFKQQQRDDKAADKEAARKQQIEREDKELHSKWLAQSNSTATQSHMAGLMTWPNGGSKIKGAIARLVDAKLLIATQMPVKSGKNGERMVGS
ncbi:MAG TPA: hypothetical protein VHR66_18880 [Gemmataceae bacterium]|jgi:hypothetical protein|nr:hypothetical protein [Gemmataceae bacterium]